MTVKATKGNHMNQTIGLSPKLLAAVVAAVASYLLGQTILELPAVAVLALQVLTVAVGAYVTSPGEVEEFGPEPPM
ncbi:MAG: hypothetical protein H0W36_02620 [Gemmatimonadetes bacterium]|nr:hypothetical protein [Gemmatimonadota bacterium]